MDAPVVGVLGLQGASEPHREMLASIGVDAADVRTPEQLEALTHLVLPGGESTTIHHLLELFGLRERIVERHRRGELALFGTCAGAILLGRGEGRPPRLRLLDAEFERNAYGRQVDSFAADVALAKDIEGGPMRGVFIRAPRVRSVGRDVEVLGRRGDEPVLLRGGAVLASCFHPELSGDARIHRYFLRMQPAARTV